MFFSLNDTPPTQIYTLSLHDALPISAIFMAGMDGIRNGWDPGPPLDKTNLFDLSPEELAKDRKSTRLLQSQSNLVCRLLLEKKKQKIQPEHITHTVDADGLNIALEDA